MSWLAFSLCVGAVAAFGLAVARWRPALVVERPGAVLTLVAAISVAAVALLVRLDPPGFTISVDPASEPLIPASDPGIPVYQQATLDFGNDDIYVIALEVTRGDVFTHENLETLRELTHRLRGLPGVAEVESLARVPYFHYDTESETVSGDRFFREVPRDLEALDRLRKRALEDPIYRQTLISRDARTAAINISFRPMSDTEFVALGLDEEIEGLIEEIGREGQRFYIAGRPHVRSKAHHIMVADLALLVPIAVLVAAFTLYLMSGSVWGVLIPLVACVLSTLWVYAAMAILDTDINLITLVLGPIMICIGSVYGVHVYARYELLGLATADGTPSRKNALAALVYARTPVAMAGLTTCIGFGALLINDIPAAAELGAFAMIGIAGVTLLSLSAVPAALALLPDVVHRDGQRPQPLVSRWFNTHLESGLALLGKLATEHSGPVLTFWAIAALASVLVIPRIQIDTDFISFFLDDDPVRTDFAAVNRLMAGAVPIYVLVSGEEEGVFREPSALRALARLQGELESIPGVTRVLSSVELIRVANQAMQEGDAESARIPDTRREIAESTFLLPKSKLRRFSTSNHSRANLIVRSDQFGSRAIRALETEIRDVLASVELPSGLSADVTGNVILLNRGADLLAGNQAVQVGLAAGTIFVLIVAVFRSVRVGLISMVPNVVPVLIFFGALGAGIAPLSIPTSLIGSIALGIAIDDTMHFLVAYQSHRAAGHDSEASARHCIATVGRPIVMTSIMLVVGFLVILASGFATLREFGYLTALTMAICLATDLVLLPALLVRTRA